MIYLSEIALLGISVLEAWWQARLIAGGRPIFHGWWALAYATLIAVTVFLLRLSVEQTALFVGAQGCGHLVVFNISLNRFRGLPWNYVSATSTSLIDKLEYRLFGTRAWVVEFFAGLAFVILQLFL
jgi:hypothetical protein